MLNLSYQQAYDINQWIDYVHNPAIWSYGAVISILALLESYLPKRQFKPVLMDKILFYIKLFFIFAFAFIFFTQGLIGGCIIQVPQNWLAQNYLNRPYWYPYGVVFREGLDPQYWGLLRLFYLIMGAFVGFRTWVFYQKFSMKKIEKREISS